MNQRIKILYIITQGAWGGAQRYVFDLATNLGEEFEIFVAVGEQDGPQDLQKKLEDWQADHDRAALTILQLKHLHRSIRPNQDIQAVLEIARLYQRIRPDIVHLNSTKAGIIGSFAKFGLWFRRAAVVYTVHGWVFNEPLHDKVRWLYAWLEKVTARCKDKIIVLSKPDKDSGTRVLQVSENCFTVIPLGIDTPTPAWSSTKAREVLGAYLGVSAQTPKKWVGTIANFYRTKGLDLLIEAIASIKNELPPVLFALIGEGPGAPLLESLINKHGLSDIVYLAGSLDNAASLIPAFDLFVVPSRKEGLPYVILEAMTVGCPVVATNVGGISTLIEHKKTGLLVEKPESGLIAESIRYALGHPEEMNDYAIAAKENRHHFSLPAMTEQTKATYRSLLV